MAAPKPTSAVPLAAMERSVALHVSGQPRSSVTIKFTESETRLFATLRAAADIYTPTTVIRVAGGWVRDKLLGRDSHDIDIALDNVTGRTFAEHVNTYLQSVGQKTASIGVIAANPDQSKHLETATTRVMDAWIDFVHLRTEEYDQDSRIPRVGLGTPLQVSAGRAKHRLLLQACSECCCRATPHTAASLTCDVVLRSILTPLSRQCLQDAERRDFTINSLFYNVTSDSIEDFTGRGVEDLRHRTLRTPLPPRTTFLDDPLRVLRALRFASRFGFTMVPELVASATDPEVKSALAAKVSRERIGNETESMLSGGRPVSSLRTLHASGLLDIVFSVPAGLARMHGAVKDPTGLLGSSSSSSSSSTGNSFSVAADSSSNSGDSSNNSSHTIAGAASSPSGSSEPAVLIPPCWPDAGIRIVEAVHYLISHVGKPARLCDRAAVEGVQIIPDPAAGFCEPRHAGTAVEALPDRSDVSGISPDRRRALLTAAVLHPLGGLRHIRKSRSESVVFAIIGEGLKRKHTEGEEVVTLLEGAASFSSLLSAPSLDPLQIGLVLRDIKEWWPLALYLSAAIDIAPFLYSSEAAAAAAAYSSASAAAGGNNLLAIVPQQLSAGIKSVLARHAEVAELIRSHRLDGCWALKPLLNGKEVMNLLELKGGKEIGLYVEEMVRWQLMHPHGTSAEATAFLKSIKDSGGPQVQLPPLNPFGGTLVSSPPVR